MKSIFEKVQSGEVLTLHRSKGGDVVLMSSQEYDGIMETLYQLSNPANAAHIAESIAQADQGKTVKLDIGKLWS